MDTDALRWFQLVADGMTVTEVAELHRVSQPGVSRALSRLDEQVGATLLHKAGRLLRMTHAGVVFKRYADALVHDLDDGLAAVHELLDPETGSVAVAFQLSLGTWLVPDAIAAFRSDHPRVRFRLERSLDEWGASALGEGGVDLEITSRRLAGEGVHWERLLTQRLSLVVPEGHRLAGRGAVSLAEVAEEDFVMLSRAWQLRSRTESLCEAAGFRAKVAFEVDDVSVLADFVAAGLGVAIVPEPTRGVPVVRLTDAGAHRDIGLAWSLERRLLPSADLFRRHVLERHWGSAE